MAISLQEYQEFTPTTAEYPEEKAIEYCVLGLISEIHEYRLVHLVGDEQSLCKELGDCFYYLSQLCNHLDLSLDSLSCFHILRCEPNKKGSPYCFIKQTAFMPPLSVVSGQIAIAKKYLRGDMSLEELKLKLTPILEFCWYTLRNECNFHNLLLETVLSRNIEKLTDRKNRGVIKGSGDNR